MYEWMPDAIVEACQIYEQLSLNLTFSLNEGARQEEIIECENELEILLPPSYKEFILRHNGAHLFCSYTGQTSISTKWWADSGIVLFGTQALKEFRPRIYGSFLYDDDSGIEEYKSVLPIAYLGSIGTGDFCALNLDDSAQGEYPVIDCDHELPASDWKKSVIADSMNSWLRKMFDCIIHDSSSPEYWIGNE